MQKLSVAISLSFVLVGSICFPVFAFAQCDDPDDPLGVGCGAASGLGSGDVRYMTVRILNVILGLLGIIDVCLMLYAGFKWMTAGGNEESITTAKKTIWASIIGLVIILSSYAIANFVLRELYAATTNTRTFP